MIIIMLKHFIDHFIQNAGLTHQNAQASLLFHEGDLVQCVYVINEGMIALTRHQENGTPLTLQRATKHMVLAEASVYSSRYHCNAVCVQPTSLFEIQKSKFLNMLDKDTIFANLWAKLLAHEVQSARYRSEILTRKTVAERLDGWLAWHGGALPLKGEWKSLAMQIGVSPEALYRELSKRKPSPDH